MPTDYQRIYSPRVAAVLARQSREQRRSRAISMIASAVVLAAFFGLVIVWIGVLSTY